MRWFVVFLLVANIALFFWVQQSSLNPASRAQIPPPEVGRLRLLNEPGAPVPMPAANTPDGDAQTAVVSPPATEPATPSSDMAAPPAGPPGPSVVTAEPSRPSPIIGGPAAAPSMVEDPRPARASEPAGPTPDDRAPGATAAETAGPTPADAPVAAAGRPPADPAPSEACSRVGPLDHGDADTLSGRLPPEIALVSDTSEEVAVADGYYVLIPALPDRAAGLQKLEELETAGFSDTWLFRRGAYRNAISLGLFRHRSSAQRHAGRVVAKGFDAEVRERTSPAERRWLLLRHGVDTELREGLTLPGGATVESRPCPDDRAPTGADPG